MSLRGLSVRNLNMYVDLLYVRVLGIVFYRVNMVYVADSPYNLCKPLANDNDSFTPFSAQSFTTPGTMCLGTAIYGFNTHLICMKALLHP